MYITASVFLTSCKTFLDSSYKAISQANYNIFVLFGCATREGGLWEISIMYTLSMLSVLLCMVSLCQELEMLSNMFACAARTHKQRDVTVFFFALFH